jgi:hypothetical protein
MTKDDLTNIAIIDLCSRGVRRTEMYHELVRLGLLPAGVTASVGAGWPLTKYLKPLLDAGDIMRPRRGFFITPDTLCIEQEC